MNKEEIIKICYKWKDAREALDYIDMNVSSEHENIIIILRIITEREDIPKEIMAKKMISSYTIEHLYDPMYILSEFEHMFYEFLFKETQTERTLNGRIV